MFVCFNLFCSTGIRDLLVRLLARKRIREIVIFLVVIAAALPQLMLFRGSQTRVRQFFGGEPSAHVALDRGGAPGARRIFLAQVGVLLAWTLAAYVFGRSQFERGLRFDAAEASARRSSAIRRVSRLEWWYQLPNALLPDPLGGPDRKGIAVPEPRAQIPSGLPDGLLLRAA